MNDLPQSMIPRAEELIVRKDWNGLKDYLLRMEPPDAADLLERLEPENALLVFRLLPPDRAGEVFSELEPPAQEDLIRKMTATRARAVILELPPDERTEFFEDIPSFLVRKLVYLLPAGERKEALELLGYPEESVGRLMTPDYVALRPDWTVEESFRHLRRFGRDAETLNVLYVTDENGLLIDDIPIHRLILAEPDERVERLMDRTFFSLDAYADQEEAVRLMDRYDLAALPVVDRRGVLLGIVTIDDVLDVAQEEFTEDVERKSAITPLGLNYTLASSGVLYRKRIVWLVLLALTGFLSASVISAFEDTLSRWLALAFFIPILIGSGGNTGSQSATLIIRALALGDLTLDKWWGVLKKELRVGLFLGLTLGGILCLFGFFWVEGPAIGLIIGLSMVLVVLWANLVGSILPIILFKLRLDPAVVSSPLITTLVDATGLVIYFLIAQAVFRVLH
ncbi:MAG: magnesium transporter [Candidatus Erginobacter occultus]|nr:magnesium transporter [Candidatus Erginobacter occultus]